MSEPLLEVNDLRVHFFTDEGVVKAVDGVDLTIERGKTLCLVGESGCGKSVASRAFLKIVHSPGRIVSGRMLYHRRLPDGSTQDIDIAQLPERGKEIRKIRGKEISMIFQEPMSSLSVMHTVGNQIMETLILHEAISKQAARARAIDLLRQVEIPRPDRIVDEYPFRLSGGMRQRAMIAMALACNPTLLIADEPTTALDVTVQAQILRLLLDLRDTTGLAIILITHDLGIVAQTCDTVAVMYAGRVIERARKRVLLENPLHPYTKGLTDSQPGGMTPHEPLPSIPGQPPALSNLPPGCRFHPRCRLAGAPCREGSPPLVQVADNHVSACIKWRELAAAS